MTELVPATQAATPAHFLHESTDSWVAVLESAGQLARLICATELVPAALRPKPYEKDEDGNIAYGPATSRVAAVILHGRELGLPPMTALQSTSVINGRTGISAEIMRALVRQAGHEIEFVDHTDARCIIQGRRKGVEKWTVVQWTKADADRAGLDKPDSNWRKYPRAMLMARATAELCRMEFSDVLHGLRAAEELAELVDDSVPILPGDTETAAPAIEAPAAPTVRRRQKAAETPAAPVEPAPKTAPPERERPAVAARAANKTAAAAPTDDASAPPAARSDSAGEGQGAAAAPNVAEQGGEPTGPQGHSDARVAARPESDAGSGNRAEEPAPPQGGVADPGSSSGPGRRPHPTGQPMSAEQMAGMMAQFTRLGIGKAEDRDERLALTSEIVGRNVTTANDLSRDEADQVKDVLPKCRTLDDLRAKIADLYPQEDK